MFGVLVMLHLGGVKYRLFSPAPRRRRAVGANDLQGPSGQTTRGFGGSGVQSRVWGRVRTDLSRSSPGSSNMFYWSPCEERAVRL